MTGVELKAILDKYERPPTHKNKWEVFSLYTSITGKKRDRNCLNCAIECFIELKYISKEFGENEISLYKINSKKMESKISKLTKYRIKNPFRVFGDPKIYDNTNTSDKEVEILIAYNPALRSHFEFLEVNKVVESKKIIEETIQSEILQTENEIVTDSPEIPKKSRKRKSKLID